MSLLRDIQKSAVSQDVRVSDLLRMCKLLSGRLKSEEFGLWVDQELEGYEDNKNAPPYRIVEGSIVHGNLAGPMGMQRNHVPMPFANFPVGKEHLKADSERMFILHRVSVLEDLLNSKNEGEIAETLPQEAVSLINAVNAYSNNPWQCVMAYRILPRSKIVTLLDSVKNRVLKFVMEIEEQNPNAGEALVSETPIPPHAVSHIYHNTIQGGVGNLAQGSNDVQQTATVAPVAQQLNISDWEKLAQELPVLRGRLLATASEEADYEAISGVVAAEKAIEAKDESKLVAGLKKGGQFALEAAKTIGTDVAAAVIAKALGAS